MRYLQALITGAFIMFVCCSSVNAAQRGLSTTVVSKTPFIDGEYHALIIGNNDYKDPEGLWVPLKTPIADAEAVAKVLQEIYGFSPDHIQFLKNATRADIITAFTKLGKEVGKNDSVFIYYAGHGYSDPDTKEAFWIPVDAEGKGDHTFVPNSTIKSKLSVIAERAQHVLLVSDSCFSATLIREGHRGIKPAEKTEQYYQKVAAKKSVQILAAGGVEFVDDNYKEKGHSPFTHFFLEQLKYNTESYYSATELSLEVTKVVSANVFQTPEKGVLHGAGDNNGEFFFVRQRPAEVATVKPALQQTEQRGIPAALDAEAEMWELVKESNSIDDVKSFLESFPNGRLTAAASLKLKQLERSQQRGVSSGKTEPDQRPQLAYAPKETPKPEAYRRPDVKKGLKIAIFPIYFMDREDMVKESYIWGVGKVISDTELFKEVYSYYIPLKPGPLKKIDLNIDMGKLWKKTSLFSKPEPDVELVRQKGKDLGLDAVILSLMEPGPDQATSTFHLIDVNQDKNHVSKGNHRKGQPGSFAQIINKVLHDYKDDLEK